MTFPLNSTDRPSSFLFNLPIGCSRLSEPAQLAPIAFAFQALAFYTGMCPGSSSELDRAFQAICKGSISPQDEAIRQSFLRFLENQQKSAKTPRALNLEEALGNLTSRELPPYKDFMRAVKICFQLTGLTGDDKEWMKILKRHYSTEMDSDTKEFSDLCFYLHSNHNKLQSAQEEKEHIDQVKKSQKEQIQFLGDVLNCSSEKRLKIILGTPSTASDEKRAEHLQKICNLLLRENYLLKKIAELFEHLQYELRFEEEQAIKIGQITKVMRSMYKSYEEPVEGDLASISLALIAGDLTNKILLHQKRVPKVLRHEGEFLNLINNSHFFSRFDQLSRYIEEVEKTHCGQRANRELATTARTLKNKMKITKCVFHCDNLIIYRNDVHMRTFKDLKCAPPEDESVISPLFAAFFGYFKINNNVKKGESDSFEMIDFFSKIIAIYLDNQRKQGMIYKKAHTLLCELINHQSPKNRRNFLKYKKIDIDLPGFQITLPDQLDLFSMKPFQDLKSAMGKEEGEEKVDAKLADRPKTPSSQKISDVPNEKRLSADRPSSSRPVLKQRQTPFTPNQKKTMLQKDRVETLSLIDLPNAAPFPFTYDERVMRWFKASVPLDRELFSNYSGAPPYQRKMIDLHAFSQLADYFCNQGYQVNRLEHLKETTCRILPAELSRGSNAERGYILWAVDRKNCCYHRFFHIDESPNYYDKLVRRTFSEADFPELSRARQERPKKIAHYDQDMTRDAGNVEIELDELLQILSINELNKGTRLRVFIGKSDTEDEGSAQR